MLKTDDLALYSPALHRMRLRRIGELFVRRLAVRKFKVTLEGKNLLLDMEGVSKFGVLIVTFVEATDEVLAEHTAREDFRCEPRGKALRESLLNAPDDPPIFETAEVTEVQSFDRDAKPLGLIFFPEDSDDDREPKNDA